MRIWDIHPKYLCNKHLLGEHNELHCIFNTLYYNRKAWQNHPETKRWKGKLHALYNVHKLITQEFKNRNINHKSPIPQITDNNTQTTFLHTIQKQKEILLQKSLHLKYCTCNKSLPEIVINIHTN